MLLCSKQDETFSNLSKAICHSEFPQSQVVILPCCFDEQKFSRSLADFIKEKNKELPIAEVSTKHIQNETNFLDRLRKAWAPVLGERMGDDVFGSLRSEKPAILILRSFHNTPESIDVSFLEKLKGAEDESKVRTVVISPLPYGDIKKYWRKQAKEEKLTQGYKYYASNYGNTHHPTFLELPSVEECRDFFGQQTSKASILDKLINISACYPLVLEAIFLDWKIQDEPEPDNEVQTKYKNLAKHHLNQFVESIANLTEPRYLNHILEFSLGKREAMNDLHHHPFFDLIYQTVVGDGLPQLRAESLVQLSSKVLSTLENQTFINSFRIKTKEDFERNYRSGDYQIIIKYYSEILKVLQPEQTILYYHASIMEKLSVQSIENIKQADWREIQSLLKKALSHLSEIELIDSDREQLSKLYETLEKIAGKISSCRVERFVDSIAAEKNISQDSVMFTTLFSMQINICNPSNNAHLSKQVLLTLPEQLFRIYCLYFLDLDYYGHKVQDDEYKDAASSALPNPTASKHKNFLLEEGKKYPNFALFAWLANEKAKAKKLPFISDDFSKDWGVYQSFRIDKAHAWSHTPDKKVQNYYELCQKWVNAFKLSAIRVNAINEDASDIIDDLSNPLPLLIDGRLLAIH
jgi:hypothetical protein